MKAKKVILNAIPAAFVVIASILTVIFYSTGTGEKKASVYLAIAFIVLVPFAFLAIDKLGKFNFPFYLYALTCVHVVFAVDLGTTLGFYGKISWWDLFVHGYFGFLGCAVFYYLYLRFEKTPPKPIHYIVFLLLTVSIAGFWEMYEYVADLFLHNDMQAVQSALDKGLSPVADTITDMMIAIPGALLFELSLLLSRLFKKKRS